MDRRLFFMGLGAALTMMESSPVQARGNTPCSGKKGRVAHCNGSKLVCNDGSMGASKRMCSASDAVGEEPVAGDGAIGNGRGGRGRGSRSAHASSRRGKARRR